MLLNNRIVFDAINNYLNHDEYMELLDSYQTIIIKLAGKHLYNSNIVKISNTIFVKEIFKGAKNNDKTNQRVLSVIGNDDLMKATGYELIDQVGLDYVDIEKLSDSWRFERTKSAYCVPANLEQLNKY